MDEKISQLASYTPALDADVLPIVDTANTTTKKITWANIKATLKTYFDTLYGIVATVSIATANGVSGTSSGGATPALTITLGAITPTTVNGNTLTAGSSTYTGTAAATYTFPGASATIAGIASTQTLTNKRISRRVVTTTQSATPTINTDNTDLSSITGLAQAITSFTTNLSGTPGIGDFLEIQITDNGTARALSFGTSFSASTVALPTTTVISTLLHILFEWDSGSSKWVCVAVA